MNRQKQFNAEEARSVGDALKIDWRHANLDQFRRGLHRELEYVTRNPEIDATSDEMRLTGKIVLAHLREFPAYYTRLETWEKKADTCRAQKRA